MQELSATSSTTQGLHTVVDTTCDFTRLCIISIGTNNTAVFVADSIPCTSNFGSIQHGRLSVKYQ